MQTRLLLSVGSDPDLMKTRSLVLLRAGYTVRITATAANAMDVVEERDFDVVLICHNIPERLELIAAIRANSPSTKIVVIQKERDEATALMADAAVHSLDGAEALLAALARTLAKPNLL